LTLAVLNPVLLFFRQDLQDDQDIFVVFPLPEEREKDNPPSAEKDLFERWYAC